MSVNNNIKIFSETGVSLFVIKDSDNSDGVRFIMEDDEDVVGMVIDNYEALELAHVIINMCAGVKA